MAAPTQTPSTTTTSSQHEELPARYPPSGISVLIVGAGVAGLMAGLECWRKGHDVQIIERSPTLVTAGDSFTIGQTAIRSFRNWPAMARENEEIAYDPWLAWHKMTGERVSGPKPLEFSSTTADTPNQNQENRPTRMYRHLRPKFHAMLLKQLAKIGIQVQYGKRAVEYYDDTAAKKAGIVLANGDKVDAHVVLAADGIGSHSTKVTMGHEIRARSTGYAIYRTAFPVDIAMADPVVRERFPLLEGGNTYVELWTGDGLHATFWRTHEEMSWSLTHKDTGTAAESWSHEVDPEEVLKVTSTFPDWPEVANRLIKLTPKDRLLHFKLMWRDSQPCWTSPSGRIVQLGDAAHTFLPTSGNGATQAMEDAISLAACLQLGAVAPAGEEDVLWATKVHNKLRFERVSCLQLLGVLNQESYHRSNADVFVRNTQPQAIRYLMGEWIWRHDPERYAEEKFEQALASIRNGGDGNASSFPFQSTNIPKGYTCKPWSIDELLDVKEGGGQIELEGEWE